MNEQDVIRNWVREKLDVMGRSSRKKLADFLGLTPLQVTRMLHSSSVKGARIIKGEELEKIKMFFGETSSILGRDIALPQETKADTAKIERFIAILRRSSPEQQEALLTFLEIWGKKPKK